MYACLWGELITGASLVINSITSIFSNVGVCNSNLSLKFQSPHFSARSLLTYQMPSRVPDPAHGTSAPVWQVGAVIFWATRDQESSALTEHTHKPSITSQAPLFAVFLGGKCFFHLTHCSTKKRTSGKYLLLPILTRVQPSANPVLQSIPSDHLPPAPTPTHPTSTSFSSPGFPRIDGNQSLGFSCTLALAHPLVFPQYQLQSAPFSIVKTATDHQNLLWFPNWPYTEAKVLGHWLQGPLYMAPPISATS